jgi:adenylate cyclase
MVGLCRGLQKGRGWGSLSDVEIAEGLHLARQALEAGRDDPEALWMAGDAISLLANEHAAGAGAVDRALKLNPNSAHAWMAKGWLECYQNHPRPAIEALERSIRLSPLDPLGYFCSGGLALAHLALGHYQEAMEWADRCRRDYPRSALALRLKLVACAHLGRIEEARTAAEQLLQIDPKWTIARSRANTLYPAEIWAMFEEGYRKAGLPEE